MTSEVSEAKTIHPVPRYASWLTALRYADDLHVECVRLAAENARLRALIPSVLGEWWQTKWDYFEEYAWRLHGAHACLQVPPHIVALQEAIYREGGE